MGAGYLGQRIAAELLFLGSEVRVFDTQLAKSGKAQAVLDEAIHRVLKECAGAGLLELAGVAAPGSGSCWEPYPGQGPRSALFCKSVAEAATDADVVIEAVPDSLEIKTRVFAEALSRAKPNVLLATSTLSIPLAHLQDSVRKAASRSCPQAPVRVVGLRFLAPVVFIPFVEITMSAEQMAGSDFQHVIALLESWSKTAFRCDVRGAVDGRGTRENAMEAALGSQGHRLRLDQSTALRRQEAEAKLRKVRHAGGADLATLSPADLFALNEETCCVCLHESATVTSIICGHRVLCAPCAEMTMQFNPLCPICRARFVQQTS